MYRVEKFLSEERNGYQGEGLELSQGSVDLCVALNGVATGEVLVRSRGQREVHVLFYSSHYRMQCMVGDFIGKEGVLSYRFDAAGLDAETIVRGEFYILSDAGEYHIPFSVEVRQPLQETSLGEIRNVFHFANLARENWAEAVELFYSEDFARLFVGHDRQYFGLYRGLAVQKGNEHNVDEFLVSIHKKKKNTYRVEEQGLILKDVKEHQRESITVLMDGWGMASLEIETRGEFLLPERNHLSTEDFEDNKCRVYFEIDKQWLKEGNNVGSILLHSETGTLQIPVIVNIPSKMHKKAEERKEKKKLVAELMHEYLDYMTCEDRADAALKRAEKIVEKINSQYGRNVDGRLYQANVLLSSLRINEARWILSHVENMQSKTAMTPERYGYYLYLRTLIDDSPSFKRSAGEHLSRLIGENPDNFWLVCIYLRIMGGDVDESEKLALYRQQYEMGSRSPFLYCEAYNVLLGSIVQLMELGSFEVALLTFAMRYGIYTREMADRVNELAMRKKEMTPELFRFLLRSYRIFPEDDTLHTLCTLMIRSGMRGKECFVWYELAVERQLRITSLYEYYMLSVDTRKRKLPPRMLLMYFAYQCDLDERRKAYFFSVLVEHRDEIPEMFQQYRPMIEEFATGEMEKGSISENLAIIYRYIINEWDEIKVAADKIQHIAFKHVIRTERKNVNKVIVIQDKLKAEEVYPIEKGEAYIDCYTPDYVVLLEDETGNRYSNPEDWMDKRLMSVEKLAMYLEEQEETHIGFLLHKIYISTDSDLLSAGIMSLYRKLVSSDKLEEGFRRKLSRKLMQIYFDRGRMDELATVLEEYDMEKVWVRERGEIIQYLLFLDKDEQAKQLLYTYGFEQASPKLMTRLIGRELAKSAEFDHRLMALIHDTFCRGKYTQEMLMYLCRYYEGPLKQMRDIFKACVTFDVDASALAERILQAYLFSYAYLPEIEEVFRYYNRSERKRSSVVCMYIQSMAKGYFERQLLPQNCVFEALEDWIYQGGELNDVSRIAYLYYMSSEVKEYTEKQKDIIGRLSRELVTEKQYVPFLSSFTDFLPWLKPYEDLTYLEYRTIPGSRVTLHYLLEGEGEPYCRETLTEVAAGYYCRSFVLFFGERLQYYFMEQQKDETMLTESGYIEKSDVTGDETESRFGLLNDMIMSESLGDFRTFRQLLEGYRRQSMLVDYLFLEK